MDLIDSLKDLAAKIEKQKDFINTEEATKNAFVLPFISALGYDIFDPSEVVPEFVADVGIKKGEKVDYAIMRNGKPIFLMECKKAGTNLREVQASQLYRYYAVTSARVGILTDGIWYRFFSDLEDTNKMDSKPFFEFNLLQIEEPIVNEIKKFSKRLFDLDEMLSAASELKYTREIKQILSDEFTSPSDDFIRYFCSKAYVGRATQNVVDMFRTFTKKATTQFINDKINDRLKSAMSNESKEEQDDDDEVIENTSEGENKIETTEDEMEGFYIVKSILRNIVDPRRIYHRDTQSYFGILLDDNNRKPICRLRFNYSQKKISTFDENRSEIKTPIEDLNDIYKYSDKISSSVKNYLEEEK